MWAGRMNKKEMQAFQAATEAVSPELAVSGHPEICAPQAVLIIETAGEHGPTMPPPFCACRARLSARGRARALSFFLSFFLSFHLCEGAGARLRPAVPSAPPPHDRPARRCRCATPNVFSHDAWFLSLGAWFLCVGARARACCAWLLLTCVCVIGVINTIDSQSYY
jgi:hypothetical protein